jgi:protein-disulfide isomerase
MPPGSSRPWGCPRTSASFAYADQGGLLDFVAARGISRDQAGVCLADATAIKALAERMQAQSDKDGVTGTPTFFLNGVRVDEIHWAPVEAALQRAGAR